MRENSSFYSVRERAGFASLFLRRLSLSQNPLFSQSYSSQIPNKLFCAKQYTKMASQLEQQ